MAFAAPLYGGGIPGPGGVLGGGVVGGPGIHWFGPGGVGTYPPQGPGGVGLPSVPGPAGVAGGLPPTGPGGVGGDFAPAPVPGGVGGFPPSGNGGAPGVGPIGGGLGNGGVPLPGGENDLPALLRQISAFAHNAPNPFVSAFAHTNPGSLFQHAADTLGVNGGGPEQMLHPDHQAASNIASHLHNALSMVRDPELKKSLSGALATLHKHLAQRDKENMDALAGKLSPRHMMEAYGRNHHGLESASSRTAHANHNAFVAHHNAQRTAGM